jgi:branched-chain amino acid transport system permease protein
MNYVQLVSSRWFGKGLVLSVSIFLAFVPIIFSSPYIKYLFLLCGIWALLASSLNIMHGYRGMLSFLHAGFFGIGAYTSAILYSRFGIEMWLGLPAAIVMTCIVAFILGIIVIRLPISAFIIGTIALLTIMQVIALNWISLTKGPMGITGIKAFQIGPLDFKDMDHYYYLVFLANVGFMTLKSRFVKSYIGINCIALRENRDLAQAQGISVFKYGMIALIFSSVGAGVAGSLYAHYFKIVSPEIMAWEYVAMMTIMVVVGGRGTLWGPTIGAFLLVAVPEYLRFSKMYQLTFVGAFLVTTVMLFPDGIAGIISNRIEAWRLINERRS